MQVPFLLDISNNAGPVKSLMSALCPFTPKSGLSGFLLSSAGKRSLPAGIETSPLLGSCSCLGAPKNRANVAKVRHDAAS
jgi:hypothetical protein